MKLLLSCITTFFIMASCQKESSTNVPLPPASPPDSTDLYQLPWSTSNVSFTNDFNCGGNHAHGFRVFYHDSLIMQECENPGNIEINGSFVVNDTVMHLSSTGSNGTAVFATHNGGLLWTRYEAGPPTLYGMFTVNHQLSYCVTVHSSTCYITGIGSSDLDIQAVPLVNGITEIADQGAEVADLNSFEMTLNDTATVVVVF